MSKYELNANLVEEASIIEYLQEDKKVEIALDEESYDDKAAIVDIVTGALEAIGKFIKENKSETDPLEIAIGNFLTIKCEYREGTANGDYQISLIAGSELKKAGKKVYSEDDEEEDYE